MALPQGIVIFLQVRADVKHEYYRPWWYCSTIHTFFVDSPFKGNSLLSKNIRTILLCGSRSSGEGHTVGFNPAGGATSESLIPREGPHRKVQSPRRGHSGKSGPAGGATVECPLLREGHSGKSIPVPVPVPVLAHVPVPVPF